MANAKIEKYQQDLVDKIIEKMQTNPKGWSKEWSQIPFSAYNGSGNNIYQGINQLNLSMHLISTKSADPRYFSFKQIKDMGLHLKKGSKGIEVSFWKLLKKEAKNKKGEDIIKKIPFLKTSNVFNGQNVVGLESYEKTEGFAALKDDRDLSQKLAEVIQNAGVKVDHGGNMAFYQGGETDSVMMPPPERFSSQQSYAATLLHELAHSTGHQSRQGRNMGDRILSTDGYAKEELRAELSSVFMCQRLGISYQLENDVGHIDNSAAYLKSWIKNLKDDKSELFKAASDASKITAYLVDGKSFSKDKNTQQVLNPKQQAKQAVADYKQNNAQNKDLTRGI